jgi:hypothetical protein
MAKLGEHLACASPWVKTPEPPKNNYC